LGCSKNPLMLEIVRFGLTGLYALRRKRHIPLTAAEFEPGAEEAVREREVM
jgi:hypothetical protein